MLIEYKTKSIEKVCTDAHEATKKHGTNMADKIQQRIAEIEAADSVEMMVQYHIGRCHKLSANYAGKYAVDLVQPYRLLFEKKGNEVQIARIVEIVDYH